MNEFNLTASNKNLPEYPHNGYCNCADCAEVYEWRKDILNRENAELIEQIENVNTMEIGWRILSAVIFAVAVLSFLAGVLIDKAIAFF